MLLSILYPPLRGLLGVVPRSGHEAKDIELAVLRHQLGMLRRQVSRLSFPRLDPMFLAAASRIMSRDRWSVCVARPHTLLRWHREQVKRKWTYRRPKLGRPGSTLSS